MKLNVAVQMDPIARINIRGDSTFALLLEAQKRGHGLSYYTPDKLSLRGEELVAPVQFLTVRDEVGDHFALGEAKREPLTNFDVILLRQDPPFDLAYITSTHFLERIHPKTLVVNNPASVRNAPEKLFVMNFPHLMPPTLIASIYGMNFKWMPELESPYGYPAVMALIIGLCGLLFYRFRRAGWL